jgi:hypothetical protein
MNCVSHEGNYTDDDQPLDEYGNLYRPGFRTCRHSDCINPRHILKEPKQRVREASQPKDGIDWYAVYDEVIALASKPYLGNANCSVTDCNRVHKGRNLCQNHWQMLLRQRPDMIKRHVKLPASAFDSVPEPVIRNQWTAVDKGNCQLCDKPVQARSLCVNHYQTFKRLKKRVTA